MTIRPVRAARAEGFRLLAGAAVVALLASAITAAAVPASATTQPPSVAPSCSQQVAKGQRTCFALKRTDVKEPTALSPAVPPAGYGPVELKSAYKLPTSTTTATVAIIDAFDDPTAESDLAAYRTQYGLPACTTANGCFRKVNQNGLASPLPDPNPEWAGEISLDLDAVSATCPTCHILLVEANDNFDNNLFPAVERARLMGAKYISMSWGGSENGSENDIDAQYLNHPGVVYAVSSGDFGYAAGVSYPSTSQYVVSVGGTTLNAAANPRGWTESVWYDGTLGAGSGCSSNVPKPSFQSGISACAKRADTDVSADADPATGLAVYQTYGGQGGDNWSIYGGTSASAPQIAAVYALAGTPGATDRPASYPYANPAGLFDVTSGINGSCSPAVLCHGGTGWDGPTGLGTPNGIAAFRKITVTNPGNQASLLGTPVSLQIQATDSAGQTLTYGASGLPAGLSIDSATGLISGTTSSVGDSYDVTVTVTDAAAATGTARFSWLVGDAGMFRSLAPARVLDSRGGNGVPKAAIASGHSVALQITGRGGVPVSGVAAVAIAVTVTQNAASGFLAAGADPSGAKATIVNYGQGITNLAIIPVGANGKINLTNNSASTIQLVGDLSGYYLGGTALVSGMFHTGPQTRMFDSRGGNGLPKAPIAAGHSVTVQIGGRNGVPSGIAAAAIAVTVTQNAATGFLAAGADETTTARATIVNFVHGQGITDLAIIPVGANGKITFTNHSASTIQLVGDLSGYYLGGTPTETGAFTPLAARLLDSRGGNGVPKAAIAPGHSVAVQITGRNGVPGPTAVSAVAIAITVTQNAASGFLTAGADGTTARATIVNFVHGQGITDLAFVPIGSNGKINLTNNSASTIQLVGDLAGYYVVNTICGPQPNVNAATASC